MANTDKIQVASGSCSLARQPDSIKRSKLFYNLRQIQRSQRQGGPGSRGKKGDERGSPVGESRGTGGRRGNKGEERGTPVGESRSTGGEHVPAVILGDLSRAVAILQSVLVVLSTTHRERSLSGPLLTLLELLAEESQGVAPAGEVMPEPVAPGDVAAMLDLRGIFGSGAETFIIDSLEPR